MIRQSEQASSTPSYRSSLQVQDLMHTWVPTTETGESIGREHKRMLRGEVEYMPVLEDGRIVGMLTLRVVEAMIHEMGVISELFDNLDVREVMVETGTTIDPKVPMVDAIQLMLEERINCLPVVNSEGEFLGTVTAPLLLAHLRDLLDGSALLSVPNQDAARTEPPDGYGEKR